MPLPAVAGVLVRVAVDVGVVIVADAGGAPGVGLTRLGVVRGSAPDVRVAFGPGGRRAGAVVGASTGTGARRGVRGRALARVRVVVARARDLAGAAGGAIHRPIVAARCVAGPRVVLAAGV